MDFLKVVFLIKVFFFLLHAILLLSVFILDIVFFQLLLRDIKVPLPNLVRFFITFYVFFKTKSFDRRRQLVNTEITSEEATAPLPTHDSPEPHLECSSAGVEFPVSCFFESLFAENFSLHFFIVNAILHSSNDRKIVYC